MTVTRLWQCGFDANGANSHNTEAPIIQGSFLYIAANCKTGNGLRVAGIDACIGTSFPATRQLRMGCYIIPNGAYYGNGNNIDLLRFQAGGSIIASVYSDISNVVTAWNNNVARGIILNPLVRTWQHWGIDLKVHPTAGWFYMWLDGSQKLAFTGNTGDADLTHLYIGALRVGSMSTPNADSYFDDIYLDDTTGEAAPVRPTARQFLAIVPNGNGATSGMLGSDGNATDNYALVDENEHNSDTDYVIATAAGQKDTYALTTVTPPAGMTIAAVIPHVFARKPGAEDVQVQTVLRSGTTEVLGPAQALTTGYLCYRGSRVTLDPNTGLAWTQAGIDALEAGVQSAGTFA